MIVKVQCKDNLNNELRSDVTSNNSCMQLLLKFYHNSVKSLKKTQCNLKIVFTVVKESRCFGTNVTRAKLHGTGAFHHQGRVSASSTLSSSSSSFAMRQVQNKQKCIMWVNKINKTEKLKQLMCIKRLMKWVYSSFLKSAGYDSAGCDSGSTLADTYLVIIRSVIDFVTNKFIFNFHITMNSLKWMLHNLSNQSNLPKVH